MSFFNEGRVDAQRAFGAESIHQPVASGSAVSSAPPSNVHSQTPITSTTTTTSLPEAKAKRPRITNREIAILEVWAKENPGRTPSASQAREIASQIKTQTGYDITDANVQGWYRRRNNKLKEKESPSAPHPDSTPASSSYQQPVRSPPRASAASTAQAFLSLNPFGPRRDPGPSRLAPTSASTSRPPPPPPTSDAPPSACTLGEAEVNVLRTLSRTEPNPSDATVAVWAAAIKTDPKTVVRWLHGQTRSTPASQTLQPTVVPPTPSSPSTPYQWSAPQPPPPRMRTPPLPVRKQPFAQDRSMVDRLPTPAETVSSARSLSPSPLSIHHMDYDGAGDGYGPDEDMDLETSPETTPKLDDRRSLSPDSPNSLFDDVEMADEEVPIVPIHAPKPSTPIAPPDILLKAIYEGVQEAQKGNHLLEDSSAQPTPPRLSMAEFQAKFPRMALLHSVCGSPSMSFI